MSVLKATSRAKRLRLQIARSLSTVLRAFAAPATVFRLTGVIPYLAARTAPRFLRTHPDTPPFTAPAPPSPGEEPVWIASRSRRVPRAHVACVENGVALSTGAVFDSRGRFVEAASHDFDFLDDPRGKKHGFAPKPHRFLPGIRRIGGDVVALAASNQAFYFHWVFDVLPRFWLAEQAGFGRGPFFVEAQFPFQRETLQVLGVSGPRLIDAGKTRSIAATRLIVPFHGVAPGHVFPEWAVGFLRERFLPEESDGRPPSARRLYVSRANTGHRRVLNEPEIVSLLAGYGFEVIRPEELGFREQLSLFRDAEIIVAPHGSALANLAFCAPGAKVIELFPSANIDLYYRLATQLKLDYRYVKSEDAPAAFMGSADYRIDPLGLKAALEAAI
jgi:capsular polysaccharide biosynthesis protein